MKLPWQRRSRKDRVVVARSDDRFVYVQAEGARVLRCGMELKGDGDAAAFARRVRGLGLPPADVIAVLALSDSQLLKIEAPAVPPDELKAAARWRIKDLVDTHLDDLTLDVIQVGDGSPSTQRQLFVVAAHSRLVRELSEWSHAARLELSVIEIRETAQRNLQSAAAAARGRLAQANAALMVHGAECLLTICANGELFYARRLAWQPDMLAAHHAPVMAAQVAHQSSGFADLDIVDYSDEGNAGIDFAEATPPLLIELQRSFDLWERSCPDLPLDQLVVQANEHTGMLVELLAPAMPMPVVALDADALFPGFAAAASSPELAAAALPLLGALLRVETRQL